MYFGVELHTEIFALHIAHGREGTVPTSCQRDKAIRKLSDPVSVRHPYLGDNLQHGALNRRLDLGGTILTLCGRIHLSTKCMGQGLHSIANPKYRQTCFENEILDIRRTIFIHGFRSAGEDKSLGLDSEDLFHRRVPWE